MRSGRSILYVERSLSKVSLASPYRNVRCRFNHSNDRYYPLATRPSEYLGRGVEAETESEFPGVGAEDDHVSSHLLSLRSKSELC